MEFVNVIVAGIAAYAVGAAWYMALAKPWMEASGVEVDEATGQPVNRANPAPYIVSFIGAVLVSGMMRHVFDSAQIETFGKGLVTGLGIGLFLASPWIATNYSFAGRPKALILIDAGYATLGCAVIGVVLTLF